MPITVDRDRDWPVVAFAVRYALGRKTFAPSIVIEWLKPQVCELTENQREIIARDVREWIEGSRTIVVGGRPWYPDHDRDQWLPLLAALEGGR